MYWGRFGIQRRKTCSIGGTFILYSDGAVVELGHQDLGVFFPVSDAGFEVDFSDGPEAFGGAEGELHGLRLELQFGYLSIS